MIERKIINIEYCEDCFSIVSSDAEFIDTIMSQWKCDNCWNWFCERCDDIYEINGEKMCHFCFINGKLG